MHREIDAHIGSMLSQFLTLHGCHCSEGRGDRAGGFIIDVILAYRYAWKRNLSFCGVVGGSRHDAELALLGLPPRLAMSWGCSVLPASLYRPHLRTRAEQERSDDRDTWPPAFLSRLRSGVRVNCSSRPPARVVVHLRRGDVTPTSAYRARYTSNNETLSALRRLRLEHAAVRIHTERTSAEPLEPFATRGYELVLDAPIASAWSDMICASVLLTARSSFSYVPALFSTGRVIYQTLPRHAPLPGWELMYPNEATEAQPDRPHPAPRRAMARGFWSGFSYGWSTLDVTMAVLSALAVAPYGILVALRACGLCQRSE